jgi:hypothetical protein
MTTQPHHDAASIITDAQHVLAQARQDKNDAEFKKRLSARELERFAQQIEKLAAGEGARTAALQAQVSAGVHAAEARAAIVDMASTVREDAEIQFPGDAPLLHAFGVGLRVSPSSTSQVEELAETLLAAASQHAKEATKVGLDKHGVTLLEHLRDALSAAESAHAQAAIGRHRDSAATRSLLHSVMAEASHVRLIGRRAFRSDPAHADAYASTLPRHTVQHREHDAPAPAAPPAPPAPPAPAAPPAAPSGA